MHSSAGELLPKPLSLGLPRCLLCYCMRWDSTSWSHPDMDGDLLSCCPAGTGETPTLSTLDFYMAKLHSAIESNPLQHEKLVVRIKEILSRIARWAPVSWRGCRGGWGVPVLLWDRRTELLWLGVAFLSLQ